MKVGKSIPPLFCIRVSKLAKYTQLFGRYGPGVSRSKSSLPVVWHGFDDDKKKKAN
jgi:hypothetical protein